MNGEEIRFAVEVRDRQDGPGHLHGVVLTYGQRARDRAEVFLPGSLQWPDGGIVLNRNHQRGQPIMRVTPEVRGDSVVIDAPLPDTTAGRDAATEIRSGLLRGLSVEFKAIRQTWQGGVRRIAAAKLSGIGLVDSASYDAPVEVRNETAGGDAGILGWGL